MTEKESKCRRSLQYGENEYKIKQQKQTNSALYFPIISMGFRDETGEHGDFGGSRDSY